MAFTDFIRFRTGRAVESDQHGNEHTGFTKVWNLTTFAIITVSFSLKLYVNGVRVVREKQSKIGRNNGKQEKGMEIRNKKQCAYLINF
jgi:hypothetical protein